MRVDRRRALKLLGLGAAAPAAAAPIIQYSPQGSRSFQHGVASGDPTSSSVIIWTRITPSSGADGPFEVRWSVAEDQNFRRIVARGVARAAAVSDFTVKVDVDRGLSPDRPYWYRFDCGGERSRVGMTRTLPKGPADKVVLAVVSCSRFERGLFNAYDAIARLERVDAVVHLGDYIYEECQSRCGGIRQAWAARMGRLVQPEGNLITLADYRTRHRQYKTDPDLQAAHARAPWICAWDDHESANDSWVGGAENHHPKTDGPWSERKVAAMRAYYEWMPIREPLPGKPFEAINRSFQFGDLATLIMMESRLTARAHQISYETDAPRARGPDGAVRPDMAVLRARLNDPSRQMLGARQEAWLAEEMTASVAAGRTWQVLGSQVVMGEVMAPDARQVLGPALCGAILAALPERQRERARALADIFTTRTPYNLDAWDGYPAARERVYAAMRTVGARPIVVSGDSHAFWANELHDAEQRHVGVEIGGTSVTSSGVCDVVPLLPVNRLIEEANPGRVKFTDHGAKGFILLTLTRQEALAELMAVSTIESKPYDLTCLKRYRTTPRAEGGVTELAEI
jgi:alkaline phosphatase D